MFASGKLESSNTDTELYPLELIRKGKQAAQMYILNLFTCSLMNLSMQNDCTTRGLQHIAAYAILNNSYGTRVKGGESSSMKQHIY